MIKLSASAVRGFVEECYRKGYTEEEATFFLDRSIANSDMLFAKEAEDKQLLTDLVQEIADADRKDEAKKAIESVAPAAEEAAGKIEDAGKAVADAIPQAPPSNVPTSETDDTALMDRIKELITNEKKEESKSVLNQLREILIASEKPEDIAHNVDEAVDNLDPEIAKQIINEADRSAMEEIRDSYLETHDKYRPFYNVMSDKDHIYVNEPYRI